MIIPRLRDCSDAGLNEDQLHIWKDYLAAGNWDPSGTYTRGEISVVADDLPEAITEQVCQAWCDMPQSVRDEFNNVTLVVLPYRLTATGLEIAGFVDSGHRRIVLLPYGRRWNPLVLYHELGHLVWRGLGRAERSVYEEAWDGKTYDKLDADLEQGKMKISRAQMLSESFAEDFALWLLGKQGPMPGYR